MTKEFCHAHTLFRSEGLVMDAIEFTILMPCLNEERTLRACIEEASTYIVNQHLSAEILIADNGSTDNSVQIAKDAGARVVSIDKTGYGNAIIGGILHAKGTYIIMGDCDCSYDFSCLNGFVEALRAGNKLVIGNRFTGGIEKNAMPFHHRYLGIPFLSWIGRLRYHVDVKDFHCGLRGFHKETANTLGFQCSGMEFATEMIGKFAIYGHSIKEIPVSLRRDRRDGKSHLRSFSDGFRHLRYMMIGR